jgi:hypothetical protein
MRGATRSKKGVNRLKSGAIRANVGRRKRVNVGQRICPKADIFGRLLFSGLPIKIYSEYSDNL